jgi:hypothetical protein
MVLLSGCEDEILNNQVTGVGDVVTKTLDLSSFNSISNTGVANIFVTIGDTQSVVLKAQQNIINVMTYSVTSNTLEIGLKNNIGIKESKGIIFEITIPEINEIELEGVGDFDMEGDLQDELYISHTGVGNFYVYDMEVDICHINFTGIGLCKVKVNNTLNVTITGIGKVYYRGDPTITSSITGLGSLIDDN